MINRILQGLTACLAVILIASPAAAATTPSALPASPIAMGMSMIPFDSTTTYNYAVNKFGKNPAAWAVWARKGLNPSLRPATRPFSSCSR